MTVEDGLQARRESVYLFGFNFDLDAIISTSTKHRDGAILSSSSYLYYVCLFSRVGIYVSLIIIILWHTCL